MLQLVLYVFLFLDVERDTCMVPEVFRPTSYLRCSVDVCGGILRLKCDLCAFDVVNYAGNLGVDVPCLVDECGLLCQFTETKATGEREKNCAEMLQRPFSIGKQTSREHSREHPTATASTYRRVGLDENRKLQGGSFEGRGFRNKSCGIVCGSRGGGGGRPRRCNGCKFI
jgi:hypothetical protein